MLRVYKWRDAYWRFEDGKAPDGAMLVEVATKGVAAETPRKNAPARRTTRARKPKQKK